jgi:LacI family transcriptional regulator
MKRRKVVLLIESSRAYGRGLLRGIGAYVRAHQSWSIYVQPHGLDEPPPKWIRKWKGDGILARITTRQTAELLRATKIPMIDLRGSVADSGIPLVGLDSCAAARLAFEHLRERGFRHLAFCGVRPDEYRFLDQRAEEFEHLAHQSGCKFTRFVPRLSAGNAPTWDSEQRQLVQWLIQLPKPIGIMACHDDRGHELLNACRDARIAVPVEVAVVGVDNDEVLCDLSEPPLTSIHSNTEEIGYRAASLLDEMMAGNLTLTGTTLVEPLGVVLRRSTDVIAVEDRIAAAAMQFIRENATNGINVKDVVQHALLSRSALERRFRKAFGRSPSDEITRIKLDRVKHLLAATDYPLPRVADLAGFEHSEHMGALFRRKTGHTPGEYRKAQREVR